ncbi:hypothetical protein [Streptomyces microflavus]|uniref:hypothetical protein n=1 Tax=Streptomyces microflavus TaxID=1919 RepID=UPI0037FD9546
MTQRNPWPQPDEDCMPECLEAQPAGFGGVPRCICERLNADAEAYYEEPSNMADMEAGYY